MEQALAAMLDEAAANHAKLACQQEQAAVQAASHNAVVSTGATTFSEASCKHCHCHVILSHSWVAHAAVCMCNAGGIA